MAEAQEQFKRLEESWGLVQAEDERKHVLISSLFSHIKDLTRQLAEAQMDLRDRKDMLEMKRSKLDSAEKQLEDVKRKYDQQCFAMVVIDGDNMPFHDDLVREGSAGGKRTASLLRQAVDAEIKARLPSFSRHYMVVIRVYANLKGLTKKYKEVLPELGSFDDFVRGFNTVEPTCDFIEAGSGKECADEKIKAAFKFGLGNLHCKQVFFGGAGDNGYARMLDSYLEDQSIRERITLLTGPPFAYELAQIKDKFTTASFDAVFRSKRLPSDTKRRVSFHITPPATPMASHSPLDYAAAAKTPGSPTPSTSSLHSVPESAKSPPPAASVAGAGAGAGVVLRNRLGQRVDSPVTYSQADFSSLKDRKLCNNFHLLGKCYYVEKYGECLHTHGDKLTGSQLDALRAIARQSPCPIGLGCSQTDCLAGHRCPREPCHLENCWFSKEMHGVDAQVVVVVG